MANRVIQINTDANRWKIIVNFEVEKNSFFANAFEFQKDITNLSYKFVVKHRNWTVIFEKELEKLTPETNGDAQLVLTKNDTTNDRESISLWEFEYDIFECNDLLWWDATPILSWWFNVFNEINC